jgi:hypothetical protein
MYMRAMIRKVRRGDDSGTLTGTTYGGRYFTDGVPRARDPAGSMPARAAYQLIHDELNLGGNPALNLASFVTTWMEPEAQQPPRWTANPRRRQQRRATSSGASAEIPLRFPGEAVLLTRY